MSKICDAQRETTSRRKYGTNMGKYWKLINKLKKKVVGEPFLTKSENVVLSNTVKGLPVWSLHVLTACRFPPKNTQDRTSRTLRYVATYLWVNFGEILLRGLMKSNSDNDSWNILIEHYNKLLQKYNDFKHHCLEVVLVKKLNRLKSKCIKERSLK